MPPLDVAITASLFTLLLISASGIGRLIIGSACMGGRSRTVVGDYLLGFLAYSALFGLAVQMRWSFATFSAAFGAFGLAGLLFCAGFDLGRVLRRLRPKRCLKARATAF